MAAKMVYSFEKGKAEGKSGMKTILGGKGANLAEMANLGLPVPAGFTIATHVCMGYLRAGGKVPKELRSQVAKALARLEKSMGARFGDPQNPLLLSVRSGAAQSMPGMMDTILNLGLNAKTMAALEGGTHNPRFVRDCFRRLLQMYGDVVLGIEKKKFEKLLAEVKGGVGAAKDTDLTAAHLDRVIGLYRALIRQESGTEFPEDPKKQLWGAIEAVFRSWNNPRARTYRALNHIPDTGGTAVNVQSMVFGNMGDDCATGVAFTRDPSTGENRFYGEFLPNAQGEDVVAGIRTPQPINKAGSDGTLPSLEETMPVLYKELDRYQRKLEKHYRDMQDLEFTIQSGKLWMLQTRTGKRTGIAAVRMAVEMAEEKRIDEKTAVMRVDPEALVQILAPVFDPAEKKKAVAAGRALTRGLNAGPGAAVGQIVFEAADAVVRGRDRKEKVILVRDETSPEDVGGMAHAQGILTARGGMTSHAAVVARGMGRPCVVGAGDLRIDEHAGVLTVKGRTLRQGDWISIDGTTGEVLEGKIQTVPSEVVQVLIEGTRSPKESRLYQQFSRFMGWADKYRRTGVRTNADTPRDSAVARKFGAAGIGLCRTEHMFFAEGRIGPFREMILFGGDYAGYKRECDEARGDSAKMEESRKKHSHAIACFEGALRKILPMQRSDFEGILEAMQGLPVTIRLLDPPLHEFLPHEREQQEDLAKAVGLSLEAVQARVEKLREANPMLGHRGCRLVITYPEIAEMQVRAILEAAVNLRKRGIKAMPEIMIPLVGMVSELEYLDKVVRETADRVFREKGAKVDYSVGTMIELPRAAVAAGKIAQVAQFFSFGTNDLTQMTFGFSRDDIGSFLGDYLRKGVLEHDPFQTIDTEGVGELVRMGVRLGRSVNRKLKIGVCGEHGGEPKSVKFFCGAGLDYVSCSPYRVPVARLAAAQAALATGKLAAEAGKQV